MISVVTLHIETSKRISISVKKSTSNYVNLGITNDYNIYNDTNHSESIFYCLGAKSNLCILKIIDS